MSGFVVTTFDWVPAMPRGFVRDIRACWALEEAGLPYRVEGTSFENRSVDHFSRQPFNQVPWLSDGETTIFESGAILLYLAERSELLMPHSHRNQVIEWLFAALNSVEMASLPWSLFKFSGKAEDAPANRTIEDFLTARLRQMEAVLAGREWLAGAFSIADIAMVDVLRLVDRFDGLAGFANCRQYVRRGTERPAFLKAHADQIAFFAEADKSRH
ncbi:glutathione S-transferase family protein [Parahaliea aestuarii]|uniref:Glutathione S-transferase family protein n=1 Tax=Parahaliea aestuarii TaxID=1852021 RepID=A0A5C9A1W0_9GAMM|nr:glutathione S-transferase family protein [Parahaliea aestuarii]TXS94863.1 glutathione S-transferase family protein [Parahaliea aestuarii]